MTAIANPPATHRGGGAPEPGGPAPHVRIAIVGSGFAGLGLAIRLRQQGIADFVVLERATDVGGTWRDNTYPGCACDVPSHLYSFSFAPNPAWSRTYSPQPEIWDYLRRCARDFGVLPHIRFEHELTGASWDEAAQRWVIDTTRGRLTAQFLVAAQGGLSDPSVPDIPGVDSFAGPAFHSARWRHDVDLRGLRVAVVGTGASAIQFVPRIQPRVARLHVFQRTPPWLVPHRDRPIHEWERRLYRTLPPAQLAVRGWVYLARESLVPGFMGGSLPIAERLARRHLERQVADPELRARLTPHYRLGCKRILPSNDYYPALTRPNVELITAGVDEVRPHSLVSTDGQEREVDAIVYGTGFLVTDMPIGQRVRGRDGRALAEVWDGSPQAHLGTTVAGFPNLFLMTGPNTGLGHTSVVIMAEAQIGYVLDALAHLDRQAAGTVEVRDDAQRRFNEETQRRLAGSVWNTGGCRSWYLDRHGRNTTLWPGTTLAYRRRLRRFDPAEHVLRPAVPAPVTA
jgi:cation diffusion facilitator CzcD-associated flavoprotein CzcO